MNFEKLTEEIKRRDFYNGQIEVIKELPKKDAQIESLSLPFSKPLTEWLKKQEINLYSHQVTAIDLIRNGANVVITTPTASGKTLAFNLPILEKLYKTESTALYIYPLKALANDQLEKLNNLCEQTGIDLKPRTYDGDTPSHQRPKIRKEARIILTNPYGLHQYLPWHQKWGEFFSNLEYVVLDEAHRYRGVFGSNVAMLIRRLRRILANYGSDPQFILSSATIANPKEFSKKLVGKDFKIVARDGSEQGKKWFIFWNPIRYPGKSVHRQATELFTIFVGMGFQTLLFTISRRLAELTSRWAKELTDKKVASYRAGYLPEERREIEEALRTGELDGVASTNALELGVDIGELDSVIMAGYPGSIISTWQQAGRAGRGAEDSVVTLMAFEDPLDQYFMKHPAKFFDSVHEHAVIDIKNPHILSGHLLCASAEFPIKEDDSQFFGKIPQILPRLEEEGLVQKTPMGWVYTGTGRPTGTVSINDISAKIISIVNEGDLIEAMEKSRAFEEAHTGAVLLHRGETYLVQKLDLEKREAQVIKEDVDYYTQAVKQSRTKIISVDKKLTLGDINLLLGNLHVKESVVAYKVMRYGQTQQTYDLNLPPVEYNSQGIWFTLPSSLGERIGESGWRGGLHGVEHALIAMSPFYALCDRWDIGGFSTPHEPSTGKPTIFIFDGFEGGIGIAAKLYHLFDQLVETTEELVKDCDCDEGCPSCIYSPKCGSGNEPLDKEATLSILTYMLRELEGNTVVEKR